MKDIESIFKKAKEVKMTPQEKNAMRLRLSSYVNNSNQYKSYVLSPYLQNIKTIWTFQGFAKVTASALIVLLIGAGSLTYASEQTLPGDLLYPIKIHVKEEIEVSLAPTTIKKVNIQKERIEKRIEEVKELQKTGELTEKQTETIKEAFVDQAKELNDSFDELQANGQEEIVVAVAEELLPSLVEFKNETTKPEPEQSTNTETTSEVTETENPEDTQLVENNTTDTNTENDISEKTVDTFAFTEFQDLTSELSEIVMIETEKIQAQATESLAVIDEKAAAEETILNEAAEIPTETETADPVIVLTKIAKTNEEGATPVTFGVLSGNIIFETVEQPTVTSAIETAEIKENNLTGKITLDINCPLGNILNNCNTDTILYTNRSIIIYSYDKTEVVATLAITENGTFGTNLPLGKYFVDTTVLSEEEKALTLPLEIELTQDSILNIDIKIDTNKTKSILQ